MIEYGYDTLSRLIEARCNPNLNTNAADADLLRRYQYAFDRSGNRLSQPTALNGGSPTVTNDTWDCANHCLFNRDGFVSGLRCVPPSRLAVSRSVFAFP
jgi:hypothetical protein